LKNDEKLRKLLGEILQIISKSSKHIDDDILKFNLDRRYSIYIMGGDIFRVRKIIEAMMENKI